MTAKIDWQLPKEGSHPVPRVQGIEIAVFLFLIVPSLILSFFALRAGSVGFTLTAVATIFRDLALVAIVVYFLWRNGEAVASVGWRARRVSLEVGIGAALFIPVFYFIAGLETLLKSIGLTTPSMPTPSLEAKGRGEVILALVLVIIVAIAEETIFRGYLLLRFEGAGIKPAASIFLSALVFSLGHGYEGSAGVVSVGVMGAIFAVVYLWRKSLVAPMTMHFLQDFIAIVLLPLLTSGRH